MISPRKRFQEDKKAVEQHQKTVSDKRFLDMLEKLKAHYPSTLAPAGNPSQGWANGLKIEGAFEILEQMVRFAEPSEPRKPLEATSLNPV